jgi:mRNA interferase MazF
MTNFRRGEIVLVLFPNSDLRTSKRRPAVVIQSDRLDLSEIDRAIGALPELTELDSALRNTLAV